MKILQRLIHTRVEPITNLLLPSEEAGFRRRKSTLDHTVLQTQNIEDCFIDLSAVYDTVWHRCPICKVLKLLPDKHMIRIIMELVQNRNLTLITGSGKQTKLRRMKNGVSKWFWSPFV